MRVVNADHYYEPRDAISHDWIKLLDPLGAVPVPVPNVLSDPWAYVRAVSPRGLVLTGGDDFEPLAGEADGADERSLRDRTEFILLERALAARWPVLGVCRGMQLINTYFGGSLAYDLKTECPQADQHVASQHRVELVAPWLRDMACAEQIIINSFHCHAVTLPRLAPSLQALALARDGIVEALEHPQFPILGVQWHPERPDPAAMLDKALMEKWLLQCA